MICAYEIPSSEDMIYFLGGQEFFKLERMWLKCYPRKTKKYVRINKKYVEEFWKYFHSLSCVERHFKFVTVTQVNRPWNDEHPCDSWDWGLDVYYFEKEGEEDEEWMKFIRRDEENDRK